MRRVAVPLIVILVAGSMVSPSMGATEDRTVTKPYTILRGQVQFNSQEVAWVGTQPETFTARRGERWVTLALEDQTGNPVRGRVQINGDAVQFCSETDEAIRVRRGQKIRVSALLGSCDDGFSIATEGTITATFSR